MNNYNYVGYCRPPKACQFAKGISGNPAGRPSGRLSLATTIRRALMSKVIVVKNGKRTKMSKLEAYITQLINRAVAGDPHACKMLMAWLTMIDYIEPCAAEELKNLRNMSKQELEEEQAYLSEMREAIARGKEKRLKSNQILPKSD